MESIHIINEHSLKYELKTRARHLTIQQLYESTEAKENYIYIIKLQTEK